MTSRAPFESLLKQHSDLELQLFIASQRYNVRAKRQAIRELKMRRSVMTPPVQRQVNPDEAGPKITNDPTSARPKGSISDVAWLGVLLGAGAIGLQLVSWTLSG